MTETKKEITGMLAYIVAARELRTTDKDKKLLILYYATNSDKDGSFFKSTPDISAETGLSDSYIWKTNKGWKAKRILTWVEGDATKANHYTLNLEMMRAVTEKSKKDFNGPLFKKKLQSQERSRRYREELKKRHAPTSRTPGTVTP